MQKPIAALILIFGLCIMSGCFSLRQQHAKVEYYMLEYDVPAFDGTAGRLACVLRISPLATAAVYNTSRIMYRERANMLDSYSYHKWRSQPGTLVGGLLQRDFRESGLFAAVVSPTDGAPAAYILEGTVEEFLESDAPGGWSARLQLAVTLYRSAAGPPADNVLLQKSYRAEVPCNKRNPRALAAAMSLALAAVSKELVGDVYNELKQTAGN